MKVWMQTLAAPVISNLLYFAVFGISFHGLVAEVQGVSYLAFLVPGLIMMGVINNAYQNPSSSLIIQKFQDLIQSLLSLPFSKLEIMLAYISSAVMRAVLIGLMTYLTALPFVDFSYTSVFHILAAIILVSLFFSFLGMIVGIWANEFEKLAFIQNFIIMPLIFFGGVFYPITKLPETFQLISFFNPIMHMINLLRYGLTGIMEFPVISSFLILLASTAILGAINYLLLRSGWKLQN